MNSFADGIDPSVDQLDSSDGINPDFERSRQDILSLRSRYVFSRYCVYCSSICLKSEI